jgi:hypothetical protein
MIETLILDMICVEAAMMTVIRASIFLLADSTKNIVPNTAWWRKGAQNHGFYFGVGHEQRI